MAGITALGTTYNLPNYTGILFNLTPTDTPFFSAIGGLSSGGQTTSTQFEWEAFDLRAAGQNVALEGADAPTAQARVRAAFSNVTQIHQEQVAVSYTKQAAYGQKSGINNAETNPITTELDWQTQQMLVQMVRDAEYSFVNGTYQLPTDNTTTRKTRGLLEAITTNVSRANAGVGTATVVAATGVWTSATHGMSVGDQVTLGAITTTTGVSADKTYYVKTVPAGTTFTLSATNGGAALTLTGDGSTAGVYPSKTITPDSLNALLQTAYDNGGISAQETGTVMVNSSQKRALSKAYASAYGQFHETSRNVGGVNLTTIETDFGVLNVMLERFVPQNKIVVVSLEQCKPVFLEIPGKGHFFAEELAKTGASDKVQLYGELGLAYGNERNHAVLSGLSV